MGYSNNIWRKILTILMIINLCFILFARFSRVFGASIDYNGSTITLDDSITDFKNIIIYQNGNDVRIFLSNNDFKAYKSDGIYYISGASEYYYIYTKFNNLDKVTISNATKYSTNYINLGLLEYITYCNCNIYNRTDNSIIFEGKDGFNSPHFDNITEIENGYPDGVFISPGDYSKSDPLYFHLLKITNTVPDGNQSTYYYDSKVFKLTKDSKYYNTYITDSNTFYYFVDRSALTLDTDSSYLYVLSNSGDSISNSYGILQPNIPGGVYDVVESDTAGVITEQQALNDKMSNINNNQQDLLNNSNNINNFLNENTVAPDTENDIDTNLNFNNSSPQFANLQTNFISRLTSIVADFGNYSLDTVDTISIPIPHSNNTIDLKSDLMISHLPNDIKFIINAFWCFIFGKYFLNYLLLIYKLITTGQLIDYYSSNDEIIVTDVL